MNTTEIKARLRDPDTVLESEYRAIHDALCDALDSWDAAPGEDVAEFVVSVLAEMRSSIRAIARDLGLLERVRALDEWLESPTK